MVMSDKISDIERKVLAVIQGGMPVSMTPYKDMAESAGLDTAELIEVLRGWQENGKIRRIGAIVNHFKVGLGAGAMVVWIVGEDKIEEVGQLLAGFDEVTHAYERPTSDEWPYSLYTMVHGESEEGVGQIVAKMSQACGVSDYRILKTEKELKKVPPTYICEEIEEHE